MYQALGKGFAMPNAAETEILKNKDSKNNNVRRLQILNTWRDHMNSSACWSIEWSVKSRQENYTGADLRWTNEFGIDQIPERRSNLKTSVGFSSSVEDLVPSLALERIDVEFWHPEPSNFLV